MWKKIETVAICTQRFMFPILITKLRVCILYMIHNVAIHIVKQYLLTLFILNIIGMFNLITFWKFFLGNFLIGIKECCPVFKTGVQKEVICVNLFLV